MSKEITGVVYAQLTKLGNAIEMVNSLQNVADPSNEQMGHFLVLHSVLVDDVIRHMQDLRVMLHEEVLPFVEGVKSVRLA